MDKKIKILLATSVIALITAGCSKNAGLGTTGNNGFNQTRACAPCNNKQSAYTYKAGETGKHSQQWYVDRWKRQQQGQQQQDQQQNTNYTGYGNYSNSNSNFDYSVAGNNGNANTTNKSIYSGSYQQSTYKPYQPVTYAGGVSATTNTTSTYVGQNAQNGNIYVVQKGDTVFEVMRQTGVYWKDIISMNNLVAPAYTINPGQRLKLR